MNKVNVLSLALSLLSISLFSCSTNENNKEIIVNFDFDEKALSVEYDNNKTYNIGTGTEGLEQCLRDLDFFQVFMSGDPINYFSEIEIVVFCV